MNPAAFVAEALADFGTVGAIAPSSRYLTRAMLRPLPLENARLVVELGPGTGVMTRALLDVLPRDATLLAFEINDRFARYLRSTITDSRLVLINARAEALLEELSRRGYRQVDAILSSLALGLMSDRQRHALLSEISICLKKKGTFTQYQYLHALQVRDRQLKKFDLSGLLGRYFLSVQRKIIWRNLPPAFVFTCRGAGVHASHLATQEFALTYK
jgi:phosphatidylethanolamine/phosphatidyl-N-methylethanolamine N-methyltransferase